MGTRSYLTNKEQVQRKENIDVNDLLFKVKQERKNKRKSTIIIATATVSTLAAVGIIISL